MQHPGTSSPNPKKKRAERLQLMLNSDEIDAVDTWRFEHRMPSRSAAVRALMNLGLKVRVGHGSRSDGMGQVASADIGIVTTDIRVTESLGQVASNAGLLVFATDPVTGFGLASILTREGISVRPPVVGLDHALEIVQDEPLDAVVLALGTREFEAEQVAKIVERSSRVLLVCLDPALAADLPECLRTVPTLSRLSVPGALVQSVRDIFATAA